MENSGYLGEDPWRRGSVGLSNRGEQFHNNRELVQSMYSLNKYNAYVKKKSYSTSIAAIRHEYSLASGIFESFALRRSW